MIQEPLNGSSIETIQTPSPVSMRCAASAFATGVVLVAAELAGQPVGMLANSFTSVSLEPPLVSINIARSSSTWPLLEQAGYLGISILSEQQQAVFRQLSGKAAERFSGLDLISRADGSLLLDGASATFIVSPEAQFDAGDHVIVLMRVHGLQRVPDRSPLVFYGSHPTHLVANGADISN